jgi:hypothetical protein
MMVTFDAKESDPKRVHDQAKRFAQKCKNENLGFDIEVSGLIHMFLLGCGVTQDEMDQIAKEIV